jgi:hypothetical protein
MDVESPALSSRKDVVRVTPLSKLPFWHRSALTGVAKKVNTIVNKMSFFIIHRLSGKFT